MKALFHNAIRLATASLATTALLMGAPTGAATAETSSTLIGNGTFSSDTSGWTPGSQTKLKLSATADPHAILSATKKKATLQIQDESAAVGEAGTYRASINVRANKAGQKGALVLSVDGDTVTKTFNLATKNVWYTVSAQVSAEASETVTVEVQAFKASLARRVRVDDVSLQQTASVSDSQNESSEAAKASGYTLSDGCKVNAKGLGDCAPYFGGATGSNEDPSSLEKTFGNDYGIRRTYYQSSQVASAVKIAKADLAAGRLPWVSFKLPYGWKGMVSGKGDAWAKDLIAQFDALDGPVWLAFHHEPEKDETDITQWTKLQERLGPMVTKTDNVAFTVVLTGWNQLYGPSEFLLDNIWPDTKVDVAGFDIYESYGTTVSGKLKLERKLKANYFDKISAWAAAKDMKWGLAETGANDRAFTDYPKWMQETYSELKQTDAVAMAYFNTPLNSKEVWALTTDTKLAGFKATLASSPRLTQS